MQIKPVLKNLPFCYNLRGSLIAFIGSYVKQTYFSSHFPPIKVSGVTTFHSYFLVGSTKSNWRKARSQWTSIAN